MDYFCTGGYLKESALEEAESLLGGIIPGWQHTAAAHMDIGWYETWENGRYENRD